MKLSKSQLVKAIQEIIKEGETITKPAPTKTPGTTPTKKPNPLMPPKEAPKPGPKGLSEDEILNKITKRFESLKETKKEATKITSILEQIVSEASIEQLQQQFVDSKKVSQEVFDEVIRVSKGKGAYATWLIAKVDQGIVEDEDIYKYEEFFEIFNKRKRDFPSPDINAYKDENSVREFEQKAIEIEEEEFKRTGGAVENSQNLVPAKGVQELASVGIKLIGVVDGFQVFQVPNSAAGNKQTWQIYRKHLANCSGRAETGKGITICTMAGEGNFDRYLNDYGGDYFVFYNLGDPLSPYQFHYESDQFKDKNNKSIF